MKNSERLLVGIVSFLIGFATMYFIYYQDTKQNYWEIKEHHVWIDTWTPQGRSGHYFNDCIRLNDYQLLHVGKRPDGVTFDSSIITFQ